MFSLEIFERIHEKRVNLMPLDELHSVLKGMYHRVPWRDTQTHAVMGMLMEPIGPHPPDQSPTDPQGSRPEGRRVSWSPSHPSSDWLGKGE